MSYWKRVQGCDLPDEPTHCNQTWLGWTGVTPRWPQGHVADSARELKDRQVRESLGWSTPPANNWGDLGMLRAQPAITV